jgi:peptidoglycan/LPS O-acetylase OafA/YrhL
MSQLLDYASPLPPRQDIAGRIVATLPLTLGVIAYALLCRPASMQRGYPPIDPIWTAVTFLWAFPVPLFVLSWPPGRFSRVALLMYAVVSGYIDACTVVEMVPHRFSFIGALGNAIPLIPVHLLCVGVVAVSDDDAAIVSRMMAQCGRCKLARD